jgi:S1-C subfamily serine protease
MHTRSLRWLAASIALATAACHGGAEPNTPAAPPENRELSHGELGGLSRSAVTVQMMREGIWGARTSTSEGEGSGFVIQHDKERVVVTAAHVVFGATEIAIVDANGRRSAVTELLALDEDADIAVLRVKGLAEDIPAVDLGEVPGVGEEVVIVSSPLGLSSTVAFGSVAAMRPEVHAVQLAAGVSPGSSGGLVADRRGHAVAVVRAKASADVGGENIALATPMQHVLDGLHKKKNVALSARPDTRSMVEEEHHELTAVASDVFAGMPASASVVVPSGSHPLEHVCARANKADVVVAVREASSDDPAAWREGLGSACATVWGGEPVVVFIGTQTVGSHVDITISRQK